MGLPLFPVPWLGTLPFRFANLAAFLEDLLHETIPRKGPAHAAPILDAARPALMGQQGADLFLQRRHSFLKRRSGHDGPPGKTDVQAVKAGFGKHPFANVQVTERSAGSRRRQQVRPRCRRQQPVAHALQPLRVGDRVQVRPLLTTRRPAEPLPADD